MEIRTVPKTISCPTNSSSVELKKVAFYNISIMHILHGQPCGFLKLKLFSAFYKKIIRGEGYSVLTWWLISAAKKNASPDAAFNKSPGGRDPAETHPSPWVAE